MTVLRGNIELVDTISKVKAHNASDEKIKLVVKELVNASMS